MKINLKYTIVTEEFYYIQISLRITVLLHTQKWINKKSPFLPGELILKTI